ncbi:MAG: aspartate kinase [Alphaproteobacteria bacterium]|nr:MAG: aspartate kinase [Alphaproteobacteria bacterium]
MAIVVMKFGGTSVGSIERINRVALHVAREVRAGNQVAVVVSAMSGETNRLIALTQEAASLHDAKEYDTVVATGEQVTCGLLAMNLQQHGIRARSWLGWQIPIRTVGLHSAARIDSIGTEGLMSDLEAGVVTVIPGFQGVSQDGRVTTLGRGGSDTSAVAVAAALQAERCDIYTDVDGVYTTDPRIETKARKIDRISYEEMLELASQGAKVLQTRSVQLAKVHNVKLKVLSSFIDPENCTEEDLAGTLVCDEGDIVEQLVVSGIAYSRDEAKITLRHVPDKPGIAAEIFGNLADAGVNVDMIVQNTSEDGKTTDLTFTVPEAEADRAVTSLKDAARKGEFGEIQADKNVSKISIVGTGMRSHSGVARKMFETLAAKGINILVISTSEIKVSVLIESEYTELAVRALHSAYELDKT